MKNILPIAIVVLLVVVGLGASFYTAQMFEPPSTKLDRQIDEQLEIAQRLLRDYNPAGTVLDPKFEAAEEQLPEVDEWRDYQTQIEQESPFADKLRSQQRDIRALSQQIADLEGSPPGRMTNLSPSQAYRELKDELRQNDQKLAEALNAVRKAVRLSEGTGQNQVSGQQHVAATRLEATLAYHQADLWRRQAGLMAAAAAEHRQRAMDLMDTRANLNQSIEVLNRELTGTDGARADFPSASPSPESPQPGGESPGTALPQTDAGDQGTDSEKSGVFSRLLGRLSGEEAEPETPNESEPALEPTDDEAPPESESPTDEPQIKQARPSLSQRLDVLEVQRRETASELRADEAEAQRLNDLIVQLESQLQQVQQEAMEIDQKMLDMEAQGVDESDPASVAPFTTRYQSLADRRAELLEEETLIKYGVATENGTAEGADRGLEALRGDLQLTSASLSSRQTLIDEIDAQIEELKELQKARRTRIDKLMTSRNNLDPQITEAVTRAMDLTTEASALEEEALALLTGPALQAADRAKRAADAYIRDARSLNAENPPDASNPRLELIARSDFLPGHADLVKADLHYMAALVGAQRNSLFTKHHRMLSQAKSAGLDPAQVAEPQPDDATGRSFPPQVIQAATALATADEAKQTALEQANLAIELFDAAANSLNQLWVVRAHKAAVHHLLANLTKGDEAQIHRNNAMIEYRRAMGNREQRWEYDVYDSIVKDLARSSQQ